MTQQEKLSFSEIEKIMLCVRTSISFYKKNPDNYAKTAELEELLLKLKRMALSEENMPL